VDAAAALAEANRAHERRYLHVSEPMDGLVAWMDCWMPKAAPSCAPP